MGSFYCPAVPGEPHAVLAFTRSALPALIAGPSGRLLCPRSRPTDVQRVYLLIAGVARKNRGAVRCDVDLSVLEIQHAIDVLQVHERLNLLIGEAETKDLSFRCRCGEV